MRRNAALFVAISVLSGLGGSAMNLVTGIWILDLTGSAGLAALAGICLYGPQLAGPWLGGVLDRVPRRPLLVVTNLVLAAAVSSLLVVRGSGQAWLLFAVATGYGVSYLLIDAGETALLPSALSPAELAHVNGWRSSAREGMKLISPAVGAGLYTWHGGQAVAVLCALMPVLVAVLYAALRPARAPSVGATEQPGGVCSGFRVLFGQRVTRVTVGLAAASIAMSGFATAPVYAVVTDYLNLPSAFLGVLLGAQGAGSVAGGLVVGRLLSRHGAVGVATVGALLFAAACLGRGLPWPPAVVVAAVVGGIGLPWTLVAAITAVQTHTPPALLGRVSATANTAMFGPIVLATPLGSAAVGLGARLSLVVAAAVCLLAVAAAVVRRSPPGGASAGSASGAAQREREPAR
ncbi:MFS transporter [Micromonospora sp. 15K316]|uniref:MFS transporter n=1 Tax=Micromonospora sp. 15K316 TaxID=2530376 RepID=UPI00104329DE|nr:MFS transporter [Micromonospora sp. 15K316]TDC37596.1 MFS transporter [Micromonospora sp. 15K316]